MGLIGRHCVGCQRVVAITSVGLCRKCREAAQRAKKRARYYHPEPPTLPASGVTCRRRDPHNERTPSGSITEPGLRVRALCYLPLPGLPPVGHGELLAQERAHRVSVFALQVEEMETAGIHEPLDYTDYRLYQFPLSRFSSPWPRL